jgi:hypothetical protein
VTDVPDQAGSSSQSTTAESHVAHNPYQPRSGAYPYALGSWGYHYPQFPTSPASPSAAAAGATQGDAVANVMASGTFPYPYTAAQYTPGQPYVAPIKYPYGAPALSGSAPAASSPSAVTKPMSSTTAQTQEQLYNSFQWKQPYTGPRDSTAQVEPQSQSESTPSNDEPESARKADEVLTSTTNNDDIVPTEVPPADNPTPTST